MATPTKLSAVLKGLPKESTAALAKQLAGADLAKIGKVRVFPLGIPYPNEWVVSVLPHTGEDAKKLIDLLAKKPGDMRWEVFPYGIVNPEIGRIDIGVRSR
jgi:hypothetical protein